MKNNQKRRIKIAEKQTGKGLQRFFIFWFPLFTYMILIFILSSQPSPKDIPDIQHLDKVVHAIGYGLLSILLFRAFNKQWDKVRNKKLIFFSFLCATVYGMANEIYQHFIPYRNASIADVFANGLGAYVFPLLYIKIPTMNIVKRFL
jgi:VanZ family protein